MMGRMESSVSSGHQTMLKSKTSQDGPFQMVIGQHVDAPSDNEDGDEDPSSSMAMSLD